MAGLDRLSASDLLTMQSAQAGWPMDIGVVAVFDGGVLVDADGRFRIEAVREAVGRRLPRVPRFRQVLHVPPRLLGPPVWVDAPTVDLTRHVQVWSLAPQADTAQLLNVVEELWSRPLDLAAPLWQMWFLPGLAGGRVAMLLKVHHVMADGVAGMALLAALLDRDAERTCRATGRPRRGRRPAPCCATSSAGCGRSRRRPSRSPARPPWRPRCAGRGRRCVSSTRSGAHPGRAWTGWSGRGAGWAWCTAAWTRCARSRTRTARP